MKGGFPPVCSAIMPVAMSDFADILAAGDALIDEEETTSNVKYHFNGKYIYVTWSKSKIDSKEEFHEKLLGRLPAGARVFGGRELH